MLEINEQRIKKLHEKLRREAEEGGYHLNPDAEFTKELVKSLLINEERYGYWACPCRLASGNKQEDLDIICPCDYRDADIDEYWACYCALYVSEKILAGERQLESIPERRPVPTERAVKKQADRLQTSRPGISLKNALPYPVWRCKVCGYLCARDAPPEVCPVCKAKKERFERFM